MTEASPALPVTVLTGFLGSGKTTLLNALLAHPGMGQTAVLINEFGEIGLDHHLVRSISEDIVLLNSGCLCCTVRGDLVDALRDLFLKRVRGEIPEFERVMIETTGLADPAPILHTLMTDPLISARYRLDGIVTTVDAVTGATTLDAQSEAVKQAAVADRLLLTKTDLAERAAVDALTKRLRDLNPGAPLIAAAHGKVDPGSILGAGLFQPGTKIPDVAGWLNEEAYRAARKAETGHEHHHHDVNRHDARISAFCLSFEEPLDWDALATWLEMLISTRGDNLLRIKGILNLAGHDKPVAVHGVQHVFHPPATLPEWPDDDRRSRLVFITRDIGQAAIEATLNAFLASASREQ